MYSIRFSEMLDKFEYLRTKDGRILDEQPCGNNGPLAFYLAFRFGRKHPHMTGESWRAAQLLTAGAVTMLDAPTLISRQDNPHYSSVEKSTYKVAQVVSQASGEIYDVYRIEWGEVLAPGAPEPDRRHTYGCTCKHYTEGNGRRPVVNGQPLCKHILAVTIYNAINQDAEKWARLRVDELTELARARRGPVDEVTRNWRADQAAKDRRAQLNRMMQATHSGQRQPAAAAAD